jgi:hypothetical protein
MATMVPALMRPAAVTANIVVSLPIVSATTHPFPG